MGRLAHGGVVVHLVHHRGERPALLAAGRGEQGYNPLQQSLYALAALGRCEQHREHLPLGHALPQRLEEPLPGHGPLLQIGLRQLRVVVGGPGQGVLPKALQGQHLAAVRAGFLHLLCRQQPGGALLAQLLQHAGDVAPRSVHLVHHQQRGDAHLLQGAPQQPCLGLHALHRGEHQHSAVQHGEAALHLAQKVHVAGGVDQVYPHALVLQRDGGRPHRDAPAALHLQPVGVGGAVVHAARLADAPAAQQQLFGHGGFPRVGMGQNAQV